MSKNFYWIEESWPGRLAIGPRPRGGEWLKDDIANWKRAQIDEVLSLLTHGEEKELDLLSEAGEVQAQGMKFNLLPIPDRQVPGSDSKMLEVLERLSFDLRAGKNLLIHCRQGIGRSGLIAAGLLVRKGMSPGAAIDAVSAARGVPVPETEEQRDWIDRYAAVLTVSN